MFSQRLLKQVTRLSMNQKNHHCLWLVPSSASFLSRSTNFNLFGSQRFFSHSRSLNQKQTNDASSENTDHDSSKNNERKKDKLSDNKFLTFLRRNDAASEAEQKRRMYVQMLSILVCGGLCLYALMYDHSGFVVFFTFLLLAGAIGL
ncbi:hypothetical protein C9374_003451 [Naegleria lovaniensis]|uniref:Uncharacterized protein n=1 Tax=Naegleria lovaniensis TaxID=51637 RepID=A0AA88GNZ3_NAELO|nr:uncharacterized protein C9374_003451 [Naegleria lovaniensis]KAG2385636.1 hypothetical protein C9374_003451 [Naegleria lovaniensis]